MSDMFAHSHAVVFHIGSVPITEPVVVTWGIMAVLALVSWIGLRRPSLRPGWLQWTLEVLVETLATQTREVLHRDPAPFLPILGTLFLYIVFANVSSVVPGVHAPTAALETPAALAIVVYFSTHAYGIRSRGLAGYLKTYVEPNPFMLPLHLLSEITRSFSLTVRLFGNIMSHELVLAIVVSLAGLLVPIPLMILGAVIGIVQAYIFTVLATVFVGGAISEGIHQGKSP
jgi:F-type H+-transporting ATPase subunit a